jgi:hypothetical protein
MKTTQNLVSHSEVIVSMRVNTLEIVSKMEGMILKCNAKYFEGQDI